VYGGHLLTIALVAVAVPSGDTTTDMKIIYTSFIMLFYSALYGLVAS
tara:strand:- start:1 stop:141 length:141 start_codon:yes stop_codon:yes gene_type:complete